MHPSQAVDFEWDEFNEEHLAGHGITVDEVEEIFSKWPLWTRNKPTGSGEWQMTGATDSGRILTIVVQTLPELQLIRAFTGWVAARNLRQVYLRQRGRGR